MGGPGVPEQGAGRVNLAVSRFQGGEWLELADPAAEEVRLRVDWEDAAAGSSGSAGLWACPYDLGTLALGHALLEFGVDNSASGRDEAALTQVAASFEGVGGTLRRFEILRRDECFYQVRLGDAFARPPRSGPGPLRPEALLEAVSGFIDSPGRWEDTACFHRAGVFDPLSGKLLLLAEDIGRHNCLDRLAGWSALAGVPLADKVLLTSARITASYCAKALRAGFRVMASRAAVTTAPVDMAARYGLSLAGFARTGENRFTVFVDGAGCFVARQNKNTPHNPARKQ